MTPTHAVEPTSGAERRGAGPPPEIRSVTPPFPTLGAEAAALLGALRDFAFRSDGSLEDLTTRYRRRAFYLAYWFIGLVGMSGPALYYALWGWKYYNPWYIAAGPALTFATFVLVLVCFHAGVYYLWGRPGFFERKIKYLKHLYVWLAYTPLAWLADPLRGFFPEWENPVVAASIPLVCYGLWRVARAGRSEFRRRELAYGVALSGVPYLIILYLYPRAAGALVRMLAL